MDVSSQGGGDRGWLLELSGVGKTYQSGGQPLQALSDISLTLEHGCFAALSGPSGSGKSSLLNIIGTLDSPTTGQVRIDGRDVPFHDDRALERLRGKTIGFVFQSFNLVPVLTAVENVEIPLFPRPLSASQRRRRALECLAAVGLSERANHYPRQLSGGQQQRVSVARALVGDPALVLADEPTANLDSVTATGLLDLMRRLNQENQTSFLFSTHDPRILERARTIIKIADGRIAS